MYINSFDEPKQIWMKASNQIDLNLQQLEFRSIQAKHHTKGAMIYVR